MGGPLDYLLPASLAVSTLLFLRFLGETAKKNILKKIDELKLDVPFLTVLLSPRYPV